MNEIAKGLIVFGLVITALGLGLAVFGKIPGFGRLPGDIYFKKDNFTFYFPLATSLLISLILTLILNLFGKK